ncbi:M20/M25/M40 family metallo-hydrolase [Draconibacterium sp. IB214405]|uniref:M20/M25/M40 family metallo-hydrolase n=1 Tax=Draconibacterium sp. IB214405 TaxID=3097352 RepID=UPI002A0F3810|nr:M20/M25/M40 family metallo-hydrolase [Draconibacterium sp. IB214405]MDX8339470.1 M20/M25/M40 family metallo-hydrolase [Draconibacterium sp. IB214405]
MKKISLFLILFISGNVLFAQNEVEKGLDAITMESIKGQLEFLASDWTEGRAVGTKGAYIAADYIASMFKTYGVQPFGDVAYTQPSRSERMAGVRPEQYRTYFQSFGLIEYEPGDEQVFSVVTSKPGSESSMDFVYKTDFYVQTGTVGQKVQAPLVFAGYGYADEDKTYDDLKKLDVAGKIVVILEGYPGHNDTTSAAYKKFKPEGRRAEYYLERNKMTGLQDAGALAVIRISPSANPMMGWAQNNIYRDNGGYNESDKRPNPYYGNRMSLPGKELGSNLSTFTVSARVANEILSGTGVDIEKFEADAAKSLEPASQVLAGKSVAFKTSVNSKVVNARNVVGYIEGKNKDEFIVVGGHYDHLGIFDGVIYNGADDNASGTVGVMEIAKAFMETGEKPEKSVVFAAWTGEEKGLFGSTYFVREAKEKDLNVVLNLNYDMIARNPEGDTLKNQAHMVYTEANTVIGETTKKHIADFDINLDLDLRPSERPGGGSDHAPFAAEDIPVFYFMAAMHPDYHQPSDELSKINWEKMQNIIKVGFLNTWKFANSDDWKKTTVKPEAE